MKRGTEKDSEMRRRLAVAAKADGLTTKQIAEKLGVTGASVQYYLAWERNRTRIRGNGVPYFKKVAA